LETPADRLGVGTAFIYWSEQRANESMDRTKTIYADGRSPLSRYIEFLVAVPETLNRLIDRDAEAVRILTAEPALAEALQRVDRLYWDRQLGKRSGRISKSPRIWTRRDERWVNWRRGAISGWQPSRRLARYLRRLEAREGHSHHDRLFQQTVNEARQDGTAAILCPILNQANEAYHHLIEFAQSVSEGAVERDHFKESPLDVGGLACQLMKWTKSPETANSPQELGIDPPREPSPSVQRPTKAKRSTQKGDAKIKLIAALTKHHKYADGGCLNHEPIGNNDLAKAAAVSGSTASEFLKEHFGGRPQYLTACQDKAKLLVSLKLLNQEFSPRHLLSGEPTHKPDLDDED
jgi:hypothetical protein